MEELSSKKIKEYLENKDINIVVYNTLDSTNTQSKRLLNSTDFLENTPYLILSEEQTAGRGRIGRSFYSPASSGLYMSYMYVSNENMADAVKITTSASVAVALAIEKCIHKEVGIKWVNDIYISGKKVCGILSESVMLDNGRFAIIIGIGININTTAFPSYISSTAGSLETDIDRNMLAALVADNLFKFSLSGLNTSIMKEYRRRFILTGKKVIAFDLGREICGTVIGVDDNGALMLQRDLDGDIIKIASGEVSIRFSH